MSSIVSIESDILSRLSSVSSESEFFAYKSEVFGKKSPLSELLKWVKDLSNEEKATFGKEINALRDRLTTAFDGRLAEIKNELIAQRLKDEYEDVTIPYPRKESGHLHPFTTVMREVEAIFTRMGFEIAESKEISTEYSNFTAVNVPANHPARDMQDTFWLEGNGNVLSTQTSSMQNEILKNHSLPLRTIILGRVFRNEDVDATHDNTFYQVEGMVVDKDIHIGHFKYTIETFLWELFHKKVSIRMRPGYFPFVEPGFEIDFSCPFCSGSGCRVCKRSGWIEFMGAGLIHPKVLIEWGIDPKVHSGFAFGFGLNRLVMIKYGINDMRHFMTPDIRFLRQF